MTFIRGSSMCLDSAWTAEFSKIDHRHDPMASMEQRPRQH